MRVGYPVKSSWPQCLKNIGGSGEEMGAVYSSDRTKSVVSDALHQDSEQEAG